MQNIYYLYMASTVHSDTILQAFKLSDTSISNFIILLLKDDSFCEHPCTKDRLKATPRTDAVPLVPDNWDNMVGELLHLPQLVKPSTNLVEEFNICDYYTVSAFFNVLDLY